jgi:hypothetical protein
MIYYPYLKDIDFLMSLTEYPVAQQYVRITILNFNEKPIQSIEGLVQSGSININGASSVRRTANLSVFVQDENANFMKEGGIFSLNKKVRIEIGLTNFTDKYTEYSTLWFPQGVFVIMGISLSNTTSGVSVSLDLKDKMVLLNGECGGTIPAATTFHEYEVLNPETGEYIISKPLITQIIPELVNHFGGEQISKILVNDIDSRVKKVMKWKENYPLYRKPKDDNSARNFTFTTVLPSGANLDNYRVYGTGEDVGFVYSDFYYPGELVANAGETVCSVLDKIKATLGNFEYFYDLDGNFVFQEIKNYLNTSKVTVDLKNIDNQDYIIDKGKGNAQYVFDNNKTIVSLSNSPQYNMIKNDFIVWGERTGVTGLKLPIRYHLVVDKKPTPGNVYTCYRKNVTNAQNEVISYSYVKALTYTKASNFPDIGEEGRIYAQTADNATHKAYYWNAGNKRAIPATEKSPPTQIKDADGKDTGYTYYYPSSATAISIKTTDWRSELFMQGVMGTRHGTDSNYYYTELANEWPKIYNLGEWSPSKNKFIEEPGFKQDLDYTGIDYFLDFIDSTAAINEFNVENIGRRSKIVNDTKVNCVFETQIPDVVLLNLDAPTAEFDRSLQECKDRGQSYSQVRSNIYNGLVQGGSQNSAYNAVRNLLYQHTQYNEGIAVQLLPMYFLEPNTRITLHDPQTNIHGDYMINSISVPLDTQGSMSLSCSKALAQI